MRAALLALLLAGCVVAPEAGVVVEPNYGVVTPDPGPGYPPRMGEVTGQLGGMAVAWETFDFSIGAFDASAWISQTDGTHQFRITGYPPGQPSQRDNLLRVTGAFAGPPATGPLTRAEVKIGNEAAQGATLQIDRIEVPPGSGYGSASGRITATLCPADPQSLAPCRLFEARFDTKVQFGS